MPLLGALHEELNMLADQASSQRIQVGQLQDHLVGAQPPSVDGKPVAEQVEEAHTLAGQIDRLQTLRQEIARNNEELSSILGRLT